MKSVRPWFPNFKGVSRVVLNAFKADSDPRNDGKKRWTMMLT
jgi:hypothetical protein